MLKLRKRKSNTRKPRRQVRKQYVDGSSNIEGVNQVAAELNEREKRREVEQEKKNLLGLLEQEVQCCSREVTMFLFHVCHQQRLSADLQRLSNEKAKVNFLFRHSACLRRTDQ